MGCVLARAPLLVLGTFCKQRLIWYLSSSSVQDLGRCWFIHICLPGLAVCYSSRAAAAGTLQWDISRSHQGQDTGPTHLLPLTTCLCLMPVRVSLVYVPLCNPGPINNVFAVLPAAHSLEVLVVVLLSNSPELVVLFALTFQDKSSLSRCYKVLFP